MTMPSKLATLSSAGIGETVEVRAILYDAGDVAAELRAGDLLTCRAVTAEWLVVARQDCGEIPVSRHDAERVQIARYPPPPAQRAGHPQ